EKIFKPHSIRGDSIQVRCVKFRCSCTMHGPCSLVVRKDKNDIWFFLHFHSFLHTGAFPAPFYQERREYTFPPFLHTSAQLFLLLRRLCLIDLCHGIDDLLSSLRSPLFTQLLCAFLNADLSL